METPRHVELKVGLFVLVGLGLLFGALWMLGADESFFARTYTLHAAFPEVAGLRDGATVQVAGMNAGLVRDLRFSEDLENKRILVDLELSTRFQDRVRKDSLASIDTQGVLGDRYINISVGSSGQPPLADGDTIQAKHSPDLMGSLRSISETLGAAIEGEGGKEAGQALVDILKSLRNVLKETEEGRGLIHHLVYDEGPARQLDTLLANLEGGSESLERVLAQVERGDGTAHALIYGKDGKELLARLSSASARIDSLLADVKEQKGLLHALVYEDPRTSGLLANLQTVSQDLKDITGSIKKGEGTLGGLVADPSVYQDLKTLLGRAERNKLLKAFIRANIDANERAEGLGPGGGAPSTSSGAR